MGIQVRECTLHDLSRADVMRWRELAHNGVEANAWLDPRFLHTAASWQEAVAPLRLLVVEDGDQWLAVLPFATERPMRRLPISVSTTATPFLATHVDRHAPLVARDRVEDAVAPLLRAYVARRGIGQLQGVPVATHLAEAIRRAAQADGMTIHETRTYATTLARSIGGDPVDVAGIELAMSYLDTGRRNMITRRARQITRELDAPLEVVDVSTDSDLYERFVEFQASGWKGDPRRGGGALALDTHHHDWISGVVAAFANDGDLLAYELRCGGTTLYSSINVRSAGAAFLLLDAYEEKFANRGPGTIGRIAAWQAALRDGVEVFDAGLDPRNPEASGLYPDSVARADLTIVGPGLAARTRHRVLDRARRVRERF